MKRRSFLKVLGISLAAPSVSIASNAKTNKKYITIHAIPGTLVYIFDSHYSEVLNHDTIGIEGKCILKVPSYHKEIGIRARYANKGLYYKPIQRKIDIEHSQEEIFLTQIEDRYI